MKFINMLQSSNKIFFELDKNWINDIQVNLSAVERRTLSLTKRRTVKKEYQVAWLLKAITLLDLTTLSGDDTLGKVEKLCIKGLNPISDSILKKLKIKKEAINVGAICVYHDLVKHAKKYFLERSIARNVLLLVKLFLKGLKPHPKRNMLLILQIVKYKDDNVKLNN